MKMQDEVQLVFGCRTYFDGSQEFTPNNVSPYRLFVSGLKAGLKNWVTDSGIWVTFAALMTWRARLDIV